LAILNLLFQYLIKISNLDEVKKNIIIITEDSDNLLNNFAKKNHLQVICHNKKIGGRFSVFSETAMILFDLESQKISDSAESLVSKLIENNLEDESNPTVNAAVILTLQEKYNINYNVNILYQYSLKDYSYWFQQLFAESLGKNKEALTPITSICPKDHHSVLQLFIGGPKNKLFNIYPPSQDSYFKNFSQLGLGKIETKTPKNLLELQCLSMIQTFKEEEIPHRIIKFTESHEDKAYNMFELFSYNILETIILGYAQNLNPYDQPSVEKIKKNTFSF
jgi:glucose-6-phosphate isomerase